LGISSAGFQKLQLIVKFQGVPKVDLGGGGKKILEGFECT
jgi:hypothetical protein